MEKYHNTLGAFQIEENTAVLADGAGEGKGAAVPLSGGRADVDLAVREHRAKGPGRARLPGGAVLRVFHARNTENNERDAQHDRAHRPRPEGSERGRSCFTQTEFEKKKTILFFRVETKKF